MYQSHFVELGAHKKTRSLVAGRLKNFPQLFSLLLFLGSFFLSESPRPLMEKLAPIPLWKLGKIKWMLYAVFSRTRWALGQVGWFIRAWSVRFYWFVYPVPGYARMVSTRFYWWYREIASRLYWKLYPIAGYAKRLLMFVSWPVLKIYWFCKFQYDKRIYPVVKGMLFDD
jgi:hypothetical protein